MAVLVPRVEAVGFADIIGIVVDAPLDDEG